MRGVVGFRLRAPVRIKEPHQVRVYEPPALGSQDHTPEAKETWADVRPGTPTRCPPVRSSAPHPSPPPANPKPRVGNGRRARTWGTSPTRVWLLMTSGRITVFTSAQEVTYTDKEASMEHLIVGLTWKFHRGRQVEVRSWEPTLRHHRTT